LHATNRAAVRDEKIISQLRLTLLKMEMPGFAPGIFISRFVCISRLVVKRPG
jgi:hypothetical protein